MKSPTVSTFFGGGGGVNNSPVFLAVELIAPVVDFHADFTGAVPFRNAVLVVRFIFEKFGFGSLGFGCGVAGTVIQLIGFILLQKLSSSASELGAVVCRNPTPSAIVITSLFQPLRNMAPASN